MKSAERYRNNVKIIETGSEVNCVSYMPGVYKISMMRMSKVTDENCERKGLNALPCGDVVPAGKGTGNLPYILKDFSAMGGCSVTLEPHLTVFDGLSALENPDDTSVV